MLFSLFVPFELIVVSGSAFGRVEVSSLDKGVFPDGQQTRYHVFITINQSKTFTLEFVTFFLLHLLCSI